MTLLLLKLLFWFIWINNVYAQTWFSLHPIANPNNPLHPIAPTYPPINSMPLIYPLQLIDASYTPGPFQSTTFVSIDPINEATSTSSQNNCILYSIPSEFFNTDLNGHCFPTCTIDSVTDSTTSRLFCVGVAGLYRTYASLQQARTTQPEFFAMNCSTSASAPFGSFPNGWPNVNPTYDSYTQIKYATSALPTYPPPNCYESEMCFKTIGLPKTVLDGPAPAFIQPNQPFYCCRTATAIPGIPTAVSYQYTCVASINDPLASTQVMKQITCKRSMNITSPSADLNGNPILQQSANSAFVCSIQCVYPYVTAHQQLQIMIHNQLGKVS